MSTVVRLAIPSDREAVVETVVAAFEHDPAMRYFFPDDATYRRDMGVFGGYLFDKRVSRGGVWVSDDCDATAMWNPPGIDFDHPTDTELFEEATRRLGPAADRILAYDEPVEAALPETPHWYLGILASHPRRRGDGLARSVAAVGLARAAEANVAAFLETTNEANLAIYATAGWHEYARLDDVPGLTVWILRNQPQPTADL